MQYELMATFNQVSNDACPAPIPPNELNMLLLHYCFLTINQILRRGQGWRACACAHVFEPLEER
jgi:hypothetical protein